MSAKTTLSDETWCPTCGQRWAEREKAERKARAARNMPTETPQMRELKAKLRASIKEAKRSGRGAR